jgi:hypothetical protein
MTKAVTTCSSVLLSKFTKIHKMKKAYCHEKDNAKIDLCLDDSSNADKETKDRQIPQVSHATQRVIY